MALYMFDLVRVSVEAVGVASHVAEAFILEDGVLVSVGEYKDCGLHIAGSVNSILKVDVGLIGTVGAFYSIGSLESPIISA